MHCFPRYDKYSGDSSYGSGDSDSYGTGPEYSSTGYSEEDSYGSAGDYSGDYYKETPNSGDYDNGYSGDSSYKDYPSLKMNGTKPVLPCDKRHKWPGAWDVNVCVTSKGGKYRFPVSCRLMLHAKLGGVKPVDYAPKGCLWAASSDWKALLHSCAGRCFICQ
jgi:hypothetical protein